MSVGAVLRYKKGSIVSVDIKATVVEIAGIITSKRIGAVLVLTAEGGVAGIVSERDVVKALSTHGADVLALTAGDLMTRDVKTATPETTVDEAMEIMDTGYFRHLPVLERGRLVGIISIRDLVKYRMMQHEHDVDNLRAYISRQVS